MSSLSSAGTLETTKQVSDFSEQQQQLLLQQQQQPESSYSLEPLDAVDENSELTLKKPQTLSGSSLLRSQGFR